MVLVPLRPEPTTNTTRRLTGSSAKDDGADDMLDRLVGGVLGVADR